MNSLEWRTRKLENILYGYSGTNIRQNLVHQPEPIKEQLHIIAKSYQTSLDGREDRLNKFLELYKEIKDLSNRSEDNAVSEAAQKELALAYYDELVKHFESVNLIEDKAKKVLDVKQWPDFRGYHDRLEELAKITKGQHLQSVSLDNKTEELIEVYNEIITSFRDNMSLWNQKLDAYENEERNSDQDV